MIEENVHRICFNGAVTRTADEGKGFSDNMMRKG
jgi:hypothetical protein